MAAGRQAVLRRRDFGHHPNGYSSVEVHSVHKNSGNAWNGSHSSSAGKFRSMHESGYRRKEKTEPGELSSESGVEFESDSDLQVRAADEVEGQFPPVKRRKYSPIVCDREEKEVRISTKNRVVPLADSTSSRPSLTCLGVGRDDVDPKCINTTIRCYGLVVADHSSDADQDQVGMVEDSVQTRDVMMSRWASDCDTPSPESDEEDMHEKKSLRCERGEVQALNSSGSTCCRSSSECDRTPNELLYNDDSVGSYDNCVKAYVTDSDDDGGSSPQSHRNINMLQSCRSVFEFERLQKINEGTYGVVYKAKEKKTGNIVALKKVKMDVDNRDGFPMSALREINILLSLNHPSVVDVKEVVMDECGNVFLVMEFMEHDLKGLMQTMKQPFSIGEVKFLMLQLLQGVKYLHDNWVLHRDLKTSNLLLNKEGELKICDLGLSRQYGSPLKPYTPLVVTLWYRAPELLLNTKQYSTAIDMWSVGCILAELVSKQPLFAGKTEIDQLNKIYSILGTHDKQSWPGLSKLSSLGGNHVKQHHNSLRKKFPAASFTGAPSLSEFGLDLLNKLLAYDPEKRITAETALNHGWFHEAPLPKCG